MNTSTIKAAAICSLAGVLFVLAPSWLAELLRGLARDALKPGQQSVVALVDSASEWREELGWVDEKEQRIEQLEAMLQANNDHFRKHQVKWLQERQRYLELKSTQAKSLMVLEKRTEPLVVTTAVTCRVLGRELAGDWRSGKLLNRGQDSGLAESDIVLRSDAPLVDQGTGLESGDPVYAGRTIIGEIAEVGRWTSTVRLVTDPEYVATVRVIRESPSGLNAAGEGFIEGTGKELCRVTNVASTANVQVGDLVFSDYRNDPDSQSMFFGVVERAELPENSQTWEIWVRPAGNIERLTSVNVLRREVNPLRMMAQ
ncbi:MAG: hypothetical protein CMJ78_16630 [Planctomycetaceae bacterium]|nr:hypothetical protein [Planctomycetaceae bacterium]